MTVDIYTVSKEVEFDAGHRVPNHKSKCRNPHGHRYRLRVTITGELVTEPGRSDEGMLADFGDLKTIMTTHVHDVLDHGFIYYKDDPWAVKTFQTKIGAFWEGATEEEAKASLEDFTFKAINVPFIPTAENLARWCWDQMVEPVEQMGFGLVLVELWETPTSLATFARY